MTKAVRHSWYNASSLDGEAGSFRRKLCVGKTDVFLQVNLNKDGTCNSIAIDANIDQQSRDFLLATVVSINIGLQKGVELEHYCKAFVKYPSYSDKVFKSSGGDYFKTSNGILDAVFTILATEFNIEIDNLVTTIEQRNKIRKFFPAILP